MIKALVEFLTRRSRPPRMTLISVIDYFLEMGWDVRQVSSPDASLSVTRPDGVVTHIAVCTSRVVLDHLLHIKGLRRSNANFAIITDFELLQDSRSKALSAGLVLLEWREMAEFDDRVNSIMTYARDELRLAKIRVSAAPQRPSQDLSLPLTKLQSDSGFFFQTARVSCSFVDRGGRSLLVTFAQWGSDPQRPTRWGEGYGVAAEISVLGFETSDPNWFPPEDTLQCLRAAEERVLDRFPTRYLLGVSQGGYGAIKYSRALGAKSVLAISPQFSIDPAVVRDSRFSSRYRSEINTGMHIGIEDVAGDISVIYDPHDEADGVHADQIGEVVACNRILAPFSGHGCAHLLQSRDVMVKLLRLASEADHAAMRTTVLGERSRNRKRGYLIALALCRAHPAISLAIFEKYRETVPQLPWENVCYRLAKVGMAGNVTEWLLAEADRKPKDAEIQACVALVALEIPDLEIASAFAQRARDLSPYNHKYIHVEELVRKARYSGGRSTTTDSST